jgi:nucleoside-diphosphate-sugar epimerase
MKVGLSGWGGFLATKLRERTEVEWVEGNKDVDVFVHLGSPTFTQAELHQHDAHVMHQYVRETIKLIDRTDAPFIFASTTGVDDIQLDHNGSTSYNLGKLYLENYVINNCDKYTILRIGTIVSSDPADIELMKPDRLQPRIKRNDLTNIPFEDYYLDVDTFVNTTMDSILNFKNGIVEYELTKYTLPKLVLLGK